MVSSFHGAGVQGPGGGVLWVLLLLGALGCGEKGRPAFGDSSGASFAFSIPSSGIVVFDCNGDGKKDVLVLNGADDPPWELAFSQGKERKPGGLIFLNSGKGVL